MHNPSCLQWVTDHAGDNKEIPRPNRLSEVQVSILIYCYILHSNVLIESGKLNMMRRGLHANAVLPRDEPATGMSYPVLMSVEKP